MFLWKPFKAHIPFHWSIFNTDMNIKKRSPFSKAAIKCELTQRNHMESLQTFRFILIIAEQKKSHKNFA